MKRSIDTTNTQDFLREENEPNRKVMLVEMEHKPGGISLVNPNAVAKRTYIDSMELSEGVSNVNTAMHANARNKLDVIGRQMRSLQELMSNVFEETKQNMDLHNVACNFVKKPGHIYHLYERPSGQKYLGMLSPDEWQNSPHNCLGSYMLESDMSWTPVQSISGRYEGVNFLNKSLECHICKLYPE